MRPSKIHDFTRPVSFKATTWLARLPKNLKIIQLLLKFLKILGQVPFRHDEMRGVFYFTWLSINTLTSLAIAYTAIFAWSVYISHMVFKKFLVFGPG